MIKRWLPYRRLALCLLPFLAILFLAPYVLRAEAVSLPDSAIVALPEKGEQTIVLAGGCFWGMEAVFQHIKGVKDVVSGYAGGTAQTAHYDQVSRGDTGHAESVNITYDPAEVSLATLLKVYFSVAHDPTELNRQGPDSGTQYRSEIFFATPDQEKTATAYIAQLQKSGAFKDPVVTKVEPLQKFYPAEDYHQDFAVKNPHHPYIMAYDQAKVDNLKAQFPDLFQGK